MLLFSSQTNMEVYVLDATTGVEQARIDVGGPVLAQVAVAAAGTMVVGDNAGTLWCLGGEALLCVIHTCKWSGV